ncbi:TMEM175 family protein [Streptomyces sp. Z423-1]|uniref:TMEM175 family protein n=1 Tax=Streptomyces sp. Z423-1 TaxID=2730915 RepID=UPI001F0F3389|nr:TMEM175 family protein [Streptomyces sp. Z423-1]
MDIEPGRRAQAVGGAHEGVFAIAITLLMLDLGVPRGLTGRRNTRRCGSCFSDLGAYALSVAALGSVSGDHRRIFRTVREIDGQVISVSPLDLDAVAQLPFHTGLASTSGTNPPRSRSTTRRSRLSAPPT